MKKRPTDAELIEIATELTECYKKIYKIYDITMKTFPLKSQEFNKVCRVGIEINRLRNLLETYCYHEGKTDLGMEHFERFKGVATNFNLI